MLIVSEVSGLKLHQEPAPGNVAVFIRLMFWWQEEQKGLYPIFFSWVRALVVPLPCVSPLLVV